MDEGKATILQMKYARIINELATMANISRREAMALFYNSDLMPLIDEGVADLHCRSDKYLAQCILEP
jgi:hypothetical protein